MIRKFYNFVNESESEDFKVGDSFLYVGKFGLGDNFKDLTGEIAFVGNDGSLSGKFDRLIGKVFFHLVYSNMIKKISLDERERIKDKYLKRVKRLRDIYDERLRKRGESIKIVDPYGEEIWDDEVFESNSRKKNKKRYNKITMADIDPYGEEDWGWDAVIDDEKFKGKYIIYKQKGLGHDADKYYFALLTSHHEIYLTHGISQSLNTVKRYRKLEPLNKREIERIKNDKILLIPHGVSYLFKQNEFGGPERYNYSSLQKYCYFLDQDYMEEYLYMNESKLNGK